MMEIHYNDLTYISKKGKNLFKNSDILTWSFSYLTYI